MESGNNNTRILILNGDESSEAVINRVVHDSGSRFSVDSVSVESAKSLPKEDVGLVFAGVQGVRGVHGSDEVKTAITSFPEARLVILYDGAITNDLLQVLAEQPVQLVRKPYEYSEIRGILDSLSSRCESPWFSMSLVMTSREAGSLKVIFPLADWLLKAGVIGPKECKELHVAFQEAITNSLEHGNLGLKSEWKDEFDDEGLDRYSLEKSSRLADDLFGERNLKVEASYDGEFLHLAIEDNGEGFDVTKVMGRPPVIDESYGRGLSLITAYMDDVGFNEKGTRITVRKRLGE